MKKDSEGEKPQERYRQIQNDQIIIQKKMAKVV